jgi:hypothetical protein
MNDDGIGAAVRLYSIDTDDLGLIHAPTPVEPDDLVAAEHGPPLRVVSVVTLGPGGPVGYLAEVEEVRLPLVAR